MTHKLKTFLIGATITDDGYEHRSHGLVKAFDEKTARWIAEKGKNWYFSWEDREDEVEVELMNDCKEISKTDEEVLIRLGVVGWID